MPFYEPQARTVIAALERRQMRGYYVPHKEDVVALVRELIPEGAAVAAGGSVSLQQAGVTDELRSERYRKAERENSADVFLSSVNAVTADGELYNVDGNSNRVAALCNGPGKVVLVVGCNKIVGDLNAAVMRVKKMAAPFNAARLKRDTPCTKTGFCVALHGGMADGCDSAQRICCNYVVTGWQRTKERVHVILVGEELGY
ncbi:MAG: lactate utilization protein [Oscillospiraceae bacterium]|nr:lactate utilization protein [Oscillospiraceae bacterium]